MINFTRSLVSLCASLKNWEEPGDEAKILCGCCCCFFNPRQVLLDIGFNFMGLLLWGILKMHYKDTHFALKNTRYTATAGYMAYGYMAYAQCDKFVNSNKPHLQN